MSLLSVVVGRLDALLSARNVNPLCRANSATAYHSLHLLSESLIYQSIYKGIDGGVEQDHYGSNGIGDITRAVSGAVKA